MELQTGNTQLFRCPICQLDTPHMICGRNGEVFALACVNCAGGSLVRAAELYLYRPAWDELEGILEEQDGPPATD